MPVYGNANLIVGFRKFGPQSISNQIVDGRLGFLLVRPVVKLCNLGLDFLQKIDRHFLYFLNILLGQVFRKQHIV